MTEEEKEMNRLRLNCIDTLTAQTKASIERSVAQTEGLKKRLIRWWNGA